MAEYNVFHFKFGSSVLLGSWNLFCQILVTFRTTDLAPAEANAYLLSVRVKNVTPGIEVGNKGVSLSKSLLQLKKMQSMVVTAIMLEYFLRDS